MTKRKLMRYSQRKETITCECGVEIDVVTNAKAMSNSIDDHIVIHMQNIEGLATAAEADRIKDVLIRQAFKIAIQSKDEKMKKDRIKAEDN